MPEFVLDTSGYAVLPAQGGSHQTRTWGELDAFTQGYIEALFQAPESGNGLPVVQLGYGFSDLAPETLARIIADVALQIERYNQPNDAKKHPHLGREFWTDRQRGALSMFPPLTVSLDDAGKVVLS